MRSLRIIYLLFLYASKCQEFGLTPTYLQQHDDMKNLAAFGDAQHRGPSWYNYKSSSTEDTDSYLNSDVSKTTTSTETSESSSSESESASSYETKESKRATRTYRTCRSCPWDMLKNHKNRGVNWICGGYQRARRSFKSVCMMRYRNCQDGTLFVKLYDHRCKNDSYHGKHWFYVYKV